MSDLYRVLLVERFGTVADLEREVRQVPPPREVARRRRVLVRGLS